MLYENSNTSKLLTLIYSVLKARFTSGVEFFFVVGFFLSQGFCVGRGHCRTQQRCRSVANKSLAPTANCSTMRCNYRQLVTRAGVQLQNDVEPSTALDLSAAAPAGFQVRLRSQMPNYSHITEKRTML